jgi:hypothetical protein
MNIWDKIFVTVCTVMIAAGGLGALFVAVAMLHRLGAF